MTLKEKFARNRNGSAMLEKIQVWSNASLVLIDPGFGKIESGETIMPVWTSSISFDLQTTLNFGIRKDSEMEFDSYFL